MTDHGQSYDIGTIRELLLAAFTAEELRSLFQFASTPDLRAVVNEFSPDDGLSAMAGKSVAYCQKHLLLGELLTEVKEANPRQYARFEPRLLVAQPSPARQPRAAEARTDSRRAIPWPVFAAVGAVLVAAVIVVLVLILGDDSTLEPNIWRRPKDDTVMVHVPAGEFSMGSTDDDRYASSNEKDQHQVHVDAFWIDRTEVTNAQYRRCVDADACPPEPLGWNYETLAGPDQPVITTWEEASAYAAWVGGRLPTEAEWEKACRGVDGQIYPWGRSFDSNLVNYCDVNCEWEGNDTEGNDGYAETAPVDSFPEGRTPFDALHMAGNVWEWTQTLWSDSGRTFQYPYRAEDGREEKAADPYDSLWVMRGGGFNSDKSQVRCAARLGEQNWGYSLPGFRVVVAPGPPVD